MQELWGTWQVSRGRANRNGFSQRHEGIAADVVPCCLSPALFLLISPRSPWRLSSAEPHESQADRCSSYIGAKKRFFKTSLMRGCSTTVTQRWYQEVKRLLSGLDSVLFFSNGFPHVLVEMCFLCMFFILWIIWLAQSSRKEKIICFTVSDFCFFTSSPP